MANQVCIYFQAHQPNRLKPYSFFEIGNDHFYEDDAMNKEILFKVSEKCYLAANQMFFELIEKHKGKFKLSYSLSGTLIEQLEYFHPRVLGSFKRLADTGCVEFLAETYYHSLAFTFSEEEFAAQVKKHEEKIYYHFEQKPKVFRNTELIYNNDLAAWAQKMGYKAILTEGVDLPLKGRHPNQPFKAPNADNMRILLKNYRLSDDIAFRFEDKNWQHYPLTPQKYCALLAQERGDCVNLFMDYETIGEHHWQGSGIFDFWRGFVDNFIATNGEFKWCSELVTRKKSIQTYDIHKKFISWADTERDLSAWNQNNMQIEALDKVYGLEKYLKLCDDKDLWHIWRKLQTSDHFYYMSTKHSNDGAVHSYFSPYSSPYDAYIYFMNALTDLEITLEKKGVEVINW
jgi:alpha-amylase